MTGFLYCSLQINTYNLIFHCSFFFLNIVVFTAQSSLWIITRKTQASRNLIIIPSDVFSGICIFFFLTWSTPPLQQRCFMPFTRLLSQMHTVAWQQSHNHFIRNHHFSFWKSIMVTDWKIGCGDVIGPEYEQCVWLFYIIPAGTANIKTCVCICVYIHKDIVNLQIVFTRIIQLRLEATRQQLKMIHFYSHNSDSNFVLFFFSFFELFFDQNQSTVYASFSRVSQHKLWLVEAVHKRWISNTEFP